jgi:hypothetical protein
LRHGDRDGNLAGTYQHRDQSVRISYGDAESAGGCNPDPGRYCAAAYHDAGGLLYQLY